MFSISFYKKKTFMCADYLSEGEYSCRLCGGYNARIVKGAIFMKSWDKFLFQKFTDTTTDDLCNTEKAQLIEMHNKRFFVTKLYGPQLINI